jgi:hypothetical protein
MSTMDESEGFLVFQQPFIAGQLKFDFRATFDEARRHAETLKDGGSPVFVVPGVYRFALSDYENRHGSGKLASP